MRIHKTTGLPNPPVGTLFEFSSSSFGLSWQKILPLGGMRKLLLQRLGATESGSDEKILFLYLQPFARVQRPFGVILPPIDSDM